MVDPDYIDFVFPKYDEKINKNLKKNSTNIRSNELVFLSYTNQEWIELYNKKNGIYNFKKKKSLSKKNFRFKFKFKNILYKYLRFLFT